MFWYALLGIALSYCFVRYRENIIDVIGKIDFAEKYLGTGGSYTFLVIIAIIVFFLSLTILFGEEGKILGGLVKFF